MLKHLVYKFGFYFNTQNSYLFINIFVYYKPMNLCFPFFHVFTYKKSQLNTRTKMMLNVEKEVNNSQRETDL